MAISANGEPLGREEPEGANLRKANLRRADLRNAHLGKVDLSGANLTNLDALPRRADTEYGVICAVSGDPSDGQ
jgi:uncharacterized protein YjbI with pentapeptide repeats